MGRTTKRGLCAALLTYLEVTEVEFDEIVDQCTPPGVFQAARACGRRSGHQKTHTHIKIDRSQRLSG